MEIKCRAWNYGTSSMMDWYEMKQYSMELCNASDSDLFTTTMLWTGLEDTNRQEIYDGDIVIANAQYLSHQRYLVVWDAKRCGFYLQPLRTGRANYDKYYRMNVCKLTVVGDKYQNPELLNGDLVSKGGLHEVL